jgi:hypothetical protein
MALLPRGRHRGFSWLWRTLFGRLDSGDTLEGASEQASKLRVCPLFVLQLALQEPDTVPEFIHELKADIGFRNTGILGVTITVIL